jgi:hypothetical protein
MLFYADEVNLLGNSTNAIEENTHCRNECRGDKIFNYVSSSEIRTEPEYIDRQ